MGRDPKGTSIPTIHFQVRTVNFTEGINLAQFCKRALFCDDGFTWPELEGWKGDLQRISRIKLGHELRELSEGPP